MNTSLLPIDGVLTPISGATMSPRGGAMHGGYTHLRQLTLVFYLATFIVGE